MSRRKSAKERVLARHNNASCWYRGMHSDWAVSHWDNDEFHLLGKGQTENEAWADAAKRLRRTR
jgi:hypothetical protein